MTVYVDNMRAKFGRMVMCHMIADTDEELHAMADKIGVARRWWQAPPNHRSHYDIALSKRAEAVAAGALEITWRQTSAMTLRRIATGTLGDPEDAEAWVAAWRALRRDQRGDQLREEGESHQTDSDFAEHVEAEPEPPGLTGPAGLSHRNLAALGGSAAVAMDFPSEASPSRQHQRPNETADEASDVERSSGESRAQDKVNQRHA